MMADIKQYLDKKYKVKEDGLFYERSFARSGKR